MKAYGKLWRKLPELLEIPDQTMPGEPIIEVYGDNRVLIEGRCAVTRYDSAQIQLRNACGTVCIYGCNLCMAELSCSRMIIKGNICNITISRG